MEYAVVDFNGKQYRVMPGLRLEVEGVGKVGENISFDKVLLMVSSGEVKIGKPHVPGVFISGKVIENKKGEKLRVSKFKAKSKYRKKIGFRQSLIDIEILQFGKSEKKASTKAKAS